MYYYFYFQLFLLIHLNKNEVVSGYASSISYFKTWVSFILKDCTGNRGPYGGGLDAAASVRTAVGTGGISGSTSRCCSQYKDSLRRVPALRHSHGEVTVTFKQCPLNENKTNSDSFCAKNVRTRRNKFNRNCAVIV